MNPNERIAFTPLSCGRGGKIDWSSFIYMVCFGRCYQFFKKKSFFLQNLKFGILTSFLGAEFVFLFFSRSLALNSFIKSHQMTTFFVQNDKVFIQMLFFHSTPFFEPKKIFFDDFLMTT